MNMPLCEDFTTRCILPVSYQLQSHLNKPFLINIPLSICYTCIISSVGTAAYFGLTFLFAVFILACPSFLQPPAFFPSWSSVLLISFCSLSPLHSAYFRNQLGPMQHSATILSFIQAQGGGGNVPWHQSQV